MCALVEKLRDHALDTWYSQLVVLGRVYKARTSGWPMISIRVHFTMRYSGFATTLALLGAALSASAVVVAPRNDFSPFGLSLSGRSSLTSCGTSGPPSCQNTTVQTDLCCFESPGGLLVQTQFWDTNPVTGPVDSWTIHGLWPDNCDGTFTSSCDPSRFYPSITNILNNAGRSDLVDYMTTYMVSNSESPEKFWEHEWNTHGTCYSTLGPSCISPAGQDAVDFFNTLVNLFQTLPTYTWLANAGILPDSSTTYTLSQLSGALTSASGGFTPALYCSSGSLYQIYWYFNLKGSLVDGSFVPISAPIDGNCPSSGISYLPKN